MGFVLVAKDWTSSTLRAHARRYMGVCQKMEGIQLDSLISFPTDVAMLALLSWDLQCVLGWDADKYQHL